MIILITGGTGSFGQALVKHLLEKEKKYNKIIIYSRDEQKQESMKLKFKDNPKLRFFIGDIRDKERLNIALSRDVNRIIHAAALKIVHTSEYNPIEYIKTNIIGTQNLIECSYKLGHTCKVLFLSTDKAVSPLNLYGATKMTAEKLILAANHMFGHWGPMYSVVRYGNVTGSRGSVIPLFMQAVQSKTCLPLTDEKMTRYWITLEEAVKFVTDKLNNFEPNKVYIPDMCSFKILDLINLFSEFYNLPISNIGIRPGEKLHEQIDHNKFSNTNKNWLPKYELEYRLKEMGYLK